jgi:hypothetical protein
MIPVAKHVSTPAGQQSGHSKLEKRQLASEEAARLSEEAPALASAMSRCLAHHGTGGIPKPVVEGQSDYTYAPRREVRDPYHGIKPSPASSGRLRAEVNLGSPSRYVHEEQAPWTPGASAPTRRYAPSWSPRYSGPPLTDTREWMAHSQADPPPPFSEHGHRSDGTADFWNSEPRRPNPAVPPYRNRPHPHAGYQAREEQFPSREVPPHMPDRPTPRTRPAPPPRTRANRGRTAAGRGHGDPSSSSSSSSERSRRRPSPSPRPRHARRARSSDSDTSRSQSPDSSADLLEYMRTRRSRTFEPLAPGARIYVPQADRGQ